MKILVIGEEHIRPKVARHYRALRDARGVETVFFVDDRSGITRSSDSASGLDVVYVPDPSRGPLALLRYWRAFRRCFARMRPDVVEVYTSINFMATLPMMLYARARGVPCITVCRGEIYPPAFYALGLRRRTLLVAALRSSSLILYKEPLMEQVLDRHCAGVSRFFWGNAIPVRDEPDTARDGNHILFLNFFWERRNLDLIIRAATRLRQAIPDIRIDLVGSTEALAEKGGFYAQLMDNERRLRALAAERGVECCVRFHPFTTEVEPHFARAKVFLFPADQVFCNYSLLEAMERGVPPVVSADRDPHACRIVDDGVNGKVVPLCPEAFADAVIGLLTDEPRRRAMGLAAHRKVARDFDLARGIHTLVDTYERLPRRRETR